jgi:Mitochondrial carrier protein
VGAAIDSLVFMSVYRFLKRSLSSRVTVPIKDVTKEEREPAGTSIADSFTRLAPKHATLPVWPASLLAGAGASIFTALMSAPVDLVRERLRNGLHRSPRSALRAAISGPKQWKGLYVGVIPTICRDLPFETLEFAVFESLRRWRRGCMTSGSLLTARDNLMLGMMTGALVGAVVAPLDLVVTRVLVNPTRYSGLLASMRTIAREEGFKGLFAGSLQKLARESAASGLIISVVLTMV